jgi:hypothetical protein
MAPSVTTDVPSWNRSNELDIEIFLVNFLERRKDKFRRTRYGRSSQNFASWEQLLARLVRRTSQWTSTDAKARSAFRLRSNTATTTIAGTSLRRWP